MEKYYYFHQHKVFPFDEELEYNTTDDFSKQNELLYPITKEQADFCRVHPFASESEIKECKLRELTLDELKYNKIAKLYNYDKSPAVNGFTIESIEMWLPRDLRMSVKNSLESGISIGEEYHTLWYEGKSYTFEVEVFMGLLTQLEVYATKCFNVTALHESNIKSLESKDELELYDYTVGYPDKLQFNIE